MSAIEKVQFPGHAGSRLAARLDRPPGDMRAMALFAHCFTCSKDIFAASRIAAGLNANGIGVLRFDFTGLGASEGEFSNTNFSSNVEDLLGAVDYLREKGMPPTLLIGHSLGGAAVLAAAPKIEEVLAVVTIGAPSTADHVTHNFQTNLDEIKEKGSAEVYLAGRKFKISKQFLDDVANQDFLEKIGRMKKALLICHAPRDEVVGVENATEIFAAARHPKSFLSLDHADHLLSKREDAVYVSDVVAAWASRFFEPQDHVTDQDNSEQKPLEKGVVEVAEAGSGKFTQRVRVGSHVLTADEPKGIGDDRGPAPHDFVLSGLGACTAMTIRMYADRKGIPLEHVSVQLTRQRIKAEDCEDCETKDGEIEEISREIKIVGDLDEAARNKLLEIANKCPVHKSLSGEVKIRSSLTPAD